MIERSLNDGVLILRLAHGKASALDLELLDALLGELDGAAEGARAVGPVVVVIGAGGPARVGRGSVGARVVGSSVSPVHPIAAGLAALAVLSVLAVLPLAARERDRADREARGREKR